MTATRYQPLFDVRVTHAYYNRSGGACPDLKAVPTPACTALMASLGMISQDFGTGFRVVIDGAHVAAATALVSAAP